MPNIALDSERAAPMVFKSHTSAFVEKKRMSSTNKARKKPSSKKFVIERRMPDKSQKALKKCTVARIFLLPLLIYENHKQ